MKGAFGLVKMINFNIRYLGILSVLIGILTLFVLTSCSKSKPIEVLEEQQGVSKQHQDDISEQGQSLTDVASKAATPNFQKEKSEDHQIPDHSQKYVGRYHVEISCEDPIVHCDQGRAEFILNLSPDGSAYRTIIHLGKITYATPNQYRQDRWLYDPESHQIVLERSNGVEFYYDIEKDHSLVMNLDKIANYTEINRAFFAEGNPIPQKPYKLQKSPESGKLRD